MFKILAIYYAVGFVILTTIGIGQMVAIILKYDSDIMEKVVDALYDKSVAYNDVAWWVWIFRYIIGLTIWPWRVASANELSAWMWEKAREFKNKEEL